MDEPETLSDEQTLEMFPAAGAGSIECIQLAMGGGVVSERAWDTLSKAWVRGETRSIVNALCDAQVNVHGFLVQLLKRLWIKFLGDDTSVLGAYSVDVKPNPGISDSTRPLKILLRSGHFTKPGSDAEKLSPEGKPMVQWKDWFYPPEVPKWSLIPVPDLPADANLNELVARAKREGGNLDWVISRAIALYPDGLTGFGQSAEARAYTFCYVSRAYRVDFDLLQYNPSPQAAQLLPEFKALGDLLSTQMMPILTRLAPASHSRSGPVDLSADFAQVPFARWDALSPLPFWLYMLHRAPVGSARFFRYSLSANWVGPEAFFVPLRVEGQESKRIPFITIVSWILLGRLSALDETKDWEIGGQHMYPAELDCILSARLEDVDALLKDNQHFLGEQWRAQRENFAKGFLQVLLNSHPSQYKHHVKEVIRLVLEFCKSSPDAIPAQPVARLFLQFIALCGDYTQAFVDAMVDANRATAKLIFGGILRFLSPFPNDLESAEIAQLQKTFEEAAYEDPTSMPAHLTDRFITLVVELARHQTPITQGLCDAGIIQLLTAIRDGWYKYPDAPDLEPPHVRALLRKRMCEDALKALSDKMYLASQVRRIYAAVDAPPLPPVDALPITPAPRIRRRPSWMATGG